MKEIYDGKSKNVDVRKEKLGVIFFFGMASSLISIVLYFRGYPISTVLAPFQFIFLPICICELFRLWVWTGKQKKQKEEQLHKGFQNMEESHDSKSENISLRERILGQVFSAAVFSSLLPIILYLKDYPMRTVLGSFWFFFLPICLSGLLGIMNSRKQKMKEEQKQATPVISNLMKEGTLSSKMIAVVAVTFIGAFFPSVFNYLQGSSLKSTLTMFLVVFLLVCLGGFLKVDWDTKKQEKQKQEQLRKQANEETP